MKKIHDIQAISVFPYNKTQHFKRCDSKSVTEKEFLDSRGKKVTCLKCLKKIKEFEDDAQLKHKKAIEESIHASFKKLSSLSEDEFNEFRKNYPRFNK